MGEGADRTAVGGGADGIAVAGAVSCPIIGGFDRCVGGGRAASATGGPAGALETGLRWACGGRGGGFNRWVAWAEALPPNSAAQPGTKQGARSSPIQRGEAEALCSICGDPEQQW